MNKIQRIRGFSRKMRYPFSKLHPTVIDGKKMADDLLEKINCHFMNLQNVKIILSQSNIFKI